MIVTQHTLPPVPAQKIEIANGVFWMRMPLPFRLDHINLWLLAEKDGYTLIDTGLANEETINLWEKILVELDGPLQRIIVTHFHPDHIGLAYWLQQKTGAALWITQSEYLTAHCLWHEIAGFGPAAMTRQFRSHGLDEFHLKQYEQQGNNYRKGVANIAQSYNRLKMGDKFYLADARWKVIIGSGHSPEHASFYCAEKNLLISGDMLLPTISTNVSVFAATPEIDSLGLFLDSISLFKRLPKSTLVLPSHGLPFEGVATRVHDLIEHHNQRLTLLRTACRKKWKTAAELLPELFPQKLDSHQLMFAMGETIAHLNHLVLHGRIALYQDTNGIARYTDKTLAHE